MSPVENGPKHHEVEVKAQVMAALLSGQGVAETARQYRIPVSTVSDWKRRAWQEAGRETDIGVLLLDYLRENLTTLQVQAIAFRDRGWLKELGGSDAAVLHGVMVDKTVRLLEAMEPTEVGGEGFDWDPSPEPPRGRGL